MGLYQSADWQELDRVSRAQLLLVIEGLKPGTIINANYSSFQRILSQTGLAQELTRDTIGDVVARVGTLAAFSKFHAGALAGSSQDARPNYHILNGEFLGYPACCTAEYIRPRTPEEIKTYKANRDIRCTFDSELADRISSTGSYPHELDYCPPSFTPCSVSCPEASATLTSWGEALEKLDPAAAESLVAFNRNDAVRGPLHTAFLQEYARTHKYDVAANDRSWLRGEHNHQFAALRDNRARTQRIR